MIIDKMYHIDPSFTSIFFYCVKICFKSQSKGNNSKSLGGFMDNIYILVYDLYFQYSGRLYEQYIYWYVICISGTLGSYMDNTYQYVICISGTLDSYMDNTYISMWFVFLGLWTAIWTIHISVCDLCFWDSGQLYGQYIYQYEICISRTLGGCMDNTFISMWFVFAGLWEAVWTIHIISVCDLYLQDSGRLYGQYILYQYVICICRTLGGCMDEKVHCYTLEVSFFSYQTTTTGQSVAYTEEACILVKHFLFLSISSGIWITISTCICRSYINFRLVFLSIQKTLYIWNIRHYMCYCHKSVCSWCNELLDWSYMVDSLSYFSFQPDIVIDRQTFLD